MGGLLKKSIKAQVAMEYALSITLLLAPLGLISGFAYLTLNDTLNVFFLQNSMDRLANSIEDIYLHEPGTSTQVYVTIPHGFNYSNSYLGNTSGYGNRISIDYKGNNPFRKVAANITGNLQKLPGTFVYNVSKQDYYSVNVSVIT